MSARTLHAAVVSHSRSAGPYRRSALAGGLALGLLVLCPSAVGAEPQDGTGQRGPIEVSQPAVRPAAPGADLESAREDEAAALATLADAGTVLDEARDARDTALSWAEAAQDDLMRARIRLGDLIAAEEAAVDKLRGAVGRVEGERRGSKAYRSAFTRWQMAAVAERAAHLRRSVAARVGSERFEQLEVAEAELTDAELTLGRATSAHLKATRAVESASARVTELEAGPLASLDPPATTNERPADASPELPAAPP